MPHTIRLSDGLQAIVRTLEIAHRDLRPHLADAARLVQRRGAAANQGAAALAGRIVEVARVVRAASARPATTTGAITEDGIQEAAVELMLAACDRRPPAGGHSRAGLLTLRSRDRTRKERHKAARARLAAAGRAGTQLERFRGWPGVESGVRLGVADPDQQAPIERVAAPSGPTLTVDHCYLAAALARLPTDQARAVRLQATGHTTDEIARLRGVPAATARQWASRGTRALRAARALEEAA